MNLYILNKIFEFILAIALSTLLYFLIDIINIDLLFNMLNPAIFLLLPLIISLITSLDLKVIQNKEDYSKYLKDLKDLKKTMLNLFYLYLGLSLFYVFKINCIISFQNYLFDIGIIKNCIIISVELIFIFKPYIASLTTINNWNNKFLEEYKNQLN